MSTNKTKFCERLKELRIGLLKINEEDLSETLTEYLECNVGGEYLINIFTMQQLCKLNKLDKNYNLFDDVDTIFKAI